MERTLTFFSSGLMALEHRWLKCITLEGNYIEKEEVDLNRKYVRLITYRLALVYKIRLTTHKREISKIASGSSRDLKPFSTNKCFIIIIIIIITQNFTTSKYAVNPTSASVYYSDRTFNTLPVLKMYIVAGGR